jgi:hypothetical protein
MSGLLVNGVWLPEDQDDWYPPAPTGLTVAELRELVDPLVGKTAEWYALGIHLDVFPRRQP